MLFFWALSAVKTCWEVTWVLGNKNTCLLSCCQTKCPHCLWWWIQSSTAILVNLGNINFIWNSQRKSHILLHSHLVTLLEIRHHVRTSDQIFLQLLTTQTHSYSDKQDVQTDFLKAVDRQYCMSEQRDSAAMLPVVWLIKAECIYGWVRLCNDGGFGGEHSVSRRLVGKTMERSVDCMACFRVCQGFASVRRKPGIIPAEYPIEMGLLRVVVLEKSG